MSNTRMIPIRVPTKEQVASAAKKRKEQGEAMRRLKMDPFLEEMLYGSVTFELPPGVSLAIDSNSNWVGITP